MLLTESEQFEHISALLWKEFSVRSNFSPYTFMLYFFGAEGLGEGGALWKIPVKNTANRFLC